MNLAKHMFEKYGWTIVGTICTTDKKSRQDHNIHFLKFSNDARNWVKRGWFHEAAIKLQTKTGKIYYVQCTTWHDKKQICFLSSNRVGHSDGLKVERHAKGKKSCNTIDGTHAQKDNVTYVNAVVRNNQDSADYSTSIPTTHYYLRIFFWILDRAVHATYVVVCYLLYLPIGNKWKKYHSKNSGRHDFQIDLGIAILSYGISLESDGGSKRPDLMQQIDFFPM